MSTPMVVGQQRRRSRAGRTSTSIKIGEAVASLAALAQQSRLSVYRLLIRRSPEGFSAGELARRLGIPTATLSFHLKELVRAGLIHSHRDGRFVYYSVRIAALNDLVLFLTDHCGSDGSR